jgi:hypothetical protein
MRSGMKETEFEENDFCWPGIDQIQPLARFFNNRASFLYTFCLLM